MTAGDDGARLRLERDLFLRLLELGARDDLRPFLADALRLIVEVTGAQKGYLEVGSGAAPDRGPAEPFWIASGLDDAGLQSARRALSTGIIAEAIASGRTVSTANAGEDPRFRGQASVQAQRLEAVLCAPVGVDPAIGVVWASARSEASATRRAGGCAGGSSPARAGGSIASPTASIVRTATGIPAG